MASGHVDHFPDRVTGPQDTPGLGRLSKNGGGSADAIGYPSGGAQIEQRLARQRRNGLDKAKILGGFQMLVYPPLTTGDLAEFTQ